MELHLKMDTPVEVAIEDAQIHIAHLTRSVEELSDQVARQGDEIDRLTKSFRLLVERLSKHDMDGASDIPLSDQRPPHY
jgi:SlyX protein